MGVLVFLPFLGGCFGGVPKGTLSGKVNYRGQPVPGFLTFRPADSRQNAVTVTIDENGGYEATVPAGEVQVSIDNREWEPLGKSSPPPTIPGINLPVDKMVKGGSGETVKSNRPERVGKYVKIPEKYYTAENSGLEFTVEKGAQTKNFDLAD
jgi:hypothetical protein